MLTNDKNIDLYRQKLVKSFRRKNQLILLILLLLAIFSYGFFLYTIRTTDTDGFMINQSGKQGFLSQSISFLSLQFISSNRPTTREQTRQKLVSTINEMKLNHEFLESDKSAILAFYHSKKIDSIYYKSPIFLNKKVHRFIEEAYLLSEANNNEINYSNIHLKYITDSSENLLRDLNLITNQYQIENQDEINSLYYNRTSFLLFSLLIYIGIGVFYFRPMTKQINANLLDLSKKEKEIQNINDKQISAIINAQEKERQKVAGDLHDGLIQTLTTIAHKTKTEIEKYKHNLQTEKTLNEIKILIDEVIIETRNIAYRIIPPLLNEFGLVPALKNLCEQIKTSFKINVILQEYELKVRLDKELELTLYRIAQEALNNAVKYSKATEVLIQLIHHTNSIVLIIEDKGNGFDISDEAKWSGIGLMNIQERVRAFQGNVSINSSKDLGTEIMVEIPLN